MAIEKTYGIKYPFTNDNTKCLHMDMNGTYGDSIKSKVLHVIFTRKGERLRNPDFGTSMVDYLFEQGDSITLDKVKSEISGQIAKYVPNVKFEDIEVYNDEQNDNSKIIIVHYSHTVGMKTEVTSVAVKV